MRTFTTSRSARLGRAPSEGWFSLPNLAFLGCLVGTGLVCAGIALVPDEPAQQTALPLTTTAAAKSVGEIREDAPWRARMEGAIREAAAVASADGASINVDQTLAFLNAAPPTLRSSMQKDVAAGRAPELDAIGGPILRGAARHGIPVPVTAFLVETIKSLR